MAAAKAKTPGVVEKKLVGVADTVITAAERSKDPMLSIPIRSLANHLVAVGLEHVPRAGAKARMVIDDQHGFTHGGNSRPWPRPDPYVPATPPGG